MSNDDWMTPPYIVERVRQVLGEIDLDPMSCARANENVRAARYYDAQIDGLKQRWEGRVFLNPPYSQPLCDTATRKFLSEVKDGCLLCNFDSSTKRCQSLMSGCNFVLFNHRIAFLDPDTCEPAKGNRHPQALFYRGVRIHAFSRIFADQGWRSI